MGANNVLKSGKDLFRVIDSLEDMKIEIADYDSISILNSVMDIDDDHITEDMLDLTDAYKASLIQLLDHDIAKAKELLRKINY